LNTNASQDVFEIVRDNLRSWAEKRLSPEKRAKYRINIVGFGSFSIDQLLKHIEKRDDVGQAYVRMIISGVQRLFLGEE